VAISFSFDGDDVVWTQRFERPAVYLDTFAIREIAYNDELSARFESRPSLKRFRGCSSWSTTAWRRRRLRWTALPPNWWPRCPITGSWKPSDAKPRQRGPTMGAPANRSSPAICCVSWCSPWMPWTIATWCCLTKHGNGALTHSVSALLKWGLTCQLPPASRRATMGLGDFWIQSNGGRSRPQRDGREGDVSEEGPTASVSKGGRGSPRAVALGF